jgi:polyphosphate kinase
MLEKIRIPEAPWWIVRAVDKKKAPLNCIHHLLAQMPYKEVEHDPITLPERVHKPDHSRRPIPKKMYVPAAY